MKGKTRKRKPSNLRAGNHFGFFKTGKGDGNNSKWALFPLLTRNANKTRSECPSRGLTSSGWTRILWVMLKLLNNNCHVYWVCGNHTVKCAAQTNFQSSKQESHCSSNTYQPGRYVWVCLEYPVDEASTLTSKATNQKDQIRKEIHLKGMP